MSADSCSQIAKELVRRLDQLGRITDTPGRLTRTFLSPAMGRANSLVGRWMRATGLEAREDSMGNLIGRREGAPGSRGTFLFGSHLDTVRDAGRFDGALGVLLPIAALEVVRRRGAALPFAVEVAGFSEEEGVRFSSGYLGSKGFAGKLRGADLALCDPSGISVGQALARRLGRPFRLPAPAHAQGELIGYGEIHIEQGPVLEARGVALGVVSAIAGQTRARLTFRGCAGHAGTTPMRLRRDALAGAAEVVLFAEELARGNPPLVATVGSIAVEPGTPNVIPGAASLTLDVRHPRDAARRSALRRLLARAHAAARRRHLEFSWETIQDNGAVTCSEPLAALWERSVRAVQGRCPRMASGAGHDAVVMAAVAPMAMLFVRCRGGISHHPEEHASPADIELALRATVDFIERLAARGRS